MDLLAFWMPRWCAMGKAVAGGHIPTWLPNQFGGAPFASDPQSGWMYLPVLGLFSGVMSCTRALGLFIVLQPILAGLGLFGFLRHEGLGRPAAAVGGLTLALTVCGGSAALSMPFSGTLAWTAVALFGASGYVWARTPLRIAGWVVFTAFAVSQIAAAHLTDGLLLGAVLVGAYVVARTVAQARSGWRSWRSAVAIVVLPALAFPLLASAALIPRLALLPRSSIGHGYRALGEIGNRLSHTHALPPLYEHGLGPWWGTSFARGPGGYAGALGILVIPVAVASRRFRWPAAAFAVAGFLGWALNLDRLIASPAVRRFALNHGIGELWLRSPDRFRYLVLFALTVLAGYGLQAWLDMPKAEGRRALGRRALWLAGPVVVFVIGPMVAGARLGEYGMFLAGAAWAIPVLLFLAYRRPSPSRSRSLSLAPSPPASAEAARSALVRDRWRPLPLAVPALLLAVELVVAGLIAQLGPIPRMVAERLQTQPSTGLGHAYPKFHAPYVDPAAYQAPGPIGRALIASRDDHGRYLTFDPYIARTYQRGFLFQQGRPTWGAYENGRSVVFDLEEVQGYSPVQLDRYWRLVRAMDDRPIFYNAATFQHVNRQVLDLFGVRWMIEPTRRAGSLGTTSFLSSTVPVAREGRYSLYEVADPAPRASMVYITAPVASGQGVRTVLGPSFDPKTQAIYEPPDGFGPNSPGPGDASAAAVYHQLSPVHVQVDVRTGSPGLLVVRNAWDSNWRATVDGHPAPVLVTDYVMQGVEVGAGSHVVDLTYRDDAIGTGMIVGGSAWFLSLLILAWLWRRQRSSATRPGRSPSPGDEAPPR